MDNNIKIVQINGNIVESSAPNRLRRALKKVGIETNLLTMNTSLTEEGLILVKSGLLYRINRKIDTLLCNFEKKRHYSISEGMPFSYYRAGIKLAAHPLVKEADIIELHWICGTFLSVSGLKKLIRLGKPVIIVCHDNWHFTGGCHVRMGCEKYKEYCGKCPQLNSSVKRDWSYRLLKRKIKAVEGGNITVISPSRWMDQNVAGSRLFQGFTHKVIPNALDVTLFSPGKRERVRKQYKFREDVLVFLFGAVNAASTPYKGHTELLQALDYFIKEYKGEKEIQALVFGATGDDKVIDGKIKIHYLGFLNQEALAEAYNAADVYLVPSLEDSFNYTVAESLACETPVVAFRTGGIPDILDHKKSGYLAEYRNTEDFAGGIRWVIENNEKNVLGKAGRKKVIECFSEEVVGSRFKELYRQLGRKGESK